MEVEEIHPVPAEINFNVKLLIFGQSNTRFFFQIPIKLPTNNPLTNFDARASRSNKAPWAPSGYMFSSSIVNR